MEKRVFEKFDGSLVTDDMLQEAARLFSEHYGVWDKQAAAMMGGFAKAGERYLSSLPNNFFFFS